MACPHGLHNCDFSEWDHKRMAQTGETCQDWLAKRKAGHEFCDRLAERAKAAIQANTEANEEFWNA